MSHSTLDPAGADLLFHEARTANTFTDEPVSDEQLRQIWELTRKGPTAFNAQPLRVTWVRSPEARERLLTHMASGNRDKTAAAPAVAILSHDAKWHEHFDEFMPGVPDRSGPMAEKYASDDAASEQLARANANMQAGYFILAVRAVGLAAGPMAGFDAAGLDADFFPDGSQRSFVVVNIGQPGEGAWGDPKPRFDFDEATTTV